MPRITRAQVMDVLSSQANLAGYRAVIDATSEYGRALPMMMTPAGTVPAARAFIMGVGVAGLQAIATARRLGAVVTATDVRPATKEQVESLGAKFLAVEDEEFKNAQTAGGYAKEMSKEYQAKQAALTAEHVKKQDIVITTALIPGRPAPMLVSGEMVKSMKPGSVLIDLAVEDEEFKNAQTAGGYAKEMSKEYQAKQAVLTAEHIKKQDIIITTALIPGRPAPRLVSADMVKSMKPGSVLIDLAIERGGNVEGARPDEIVEIDGVKIVGYTNVAGRVAQSASSLYARNLFNFIETMVDKTTKSLDVKWDDELVKATALTRDGAVIHPNFQPKT
jgi:NAD/NADP transhydrogenase alpha subunit